MARFQSDGADSLDEEHKLLRATFRTFADRKVRPLAERIHRGDELIPDALIREAAELGCFGLSIPQAYGGVQDRPDNVGMVVVTEELCRGALIVGSLITRPEILAKALLKGGTEAQRQRFLPPMASGEKMVAISVTEPDFGSDVASIACAARWDGVAWRLTGTKTWCTFAGRAELIGLLARTNPDASQGYKGLSLFVVEKPSFLGHDFEHLPPGGGRLTGRAIATLGYRGMHSYELSFDDYLVPADNLVGGDAGRGKGFYLQMEGFAYGRLQTAGRALGLMQAAWEAARAYARERIVFGKPLAAYSLTQEKLVRMAATVQACRQATYAAARLLDGAAGSGRGQMEASLVKFLACCQAEWLTREAQQIHGGMGYAEEFPVSRWFVDARVLSIFEGAEEVLGLKVIVPALLRGALGK
jgi:(2S)-methylsuccinyl-CoA dehydrogenase